MAANNITFPIKNADGTAFHNLVLRNATYNSVVMSLGDKITGDVYYPTNSLVVTMQEYVEYGGIRYVLVNPPTIVKEGMVSDNSELNGMTKYSFEFYHPMYMLGNFPFTDVAVSADERKYLSDSKKFSWIGNCFDFIAKLNKNLDNTQWVVVSSGNIESEEKMQVIPDEVLAFDNNFISDALKKIYETWEVPFVIDSLHAGEYYNSSHIDYYSQEGGSKRYVIVIGLPSNEILDANSQPFVFQYGQGVGLKNNSRTPKNNKIVTRIAGYGSENNIPYGYPQIPWYGDQKWDYTINNDSTNHNSYPIYSGIYGGRWVRLIKHPFTRKNLMPSIYRQTLFNKVSPYMPREIHACPEYSATLTEELVFIDGIIAESTGSFKLVMQQLRAVMIEVATHTSAYIITIDTEQADGIVRMDDRLLMSGYVHDKQGGREFEFEDIYNDSHDDPIVANANYDPTTTLIDYYDADVTYPNPIVADAPSYETHQFEDIKPELGEKRIVDAFAYDKEHEKAITFQQFEANVDGFIANAINQKEVDALNDVLVEALSHTTDSKESWQESSVNGGSYTYKFTIVDDGYYYFKVNYTSDNATFNYLVIKNGATPPPVEWDDTMDDDGNYKQSYFKIKLPQLSFDMYACASITEEMNIIMRGGACIGCTFPIQVDWDDYKKNFYRSDGTFDPVIHVSGSQDGHVRDGEKYPDTSQGQVAVIVKKDLDTFGILMPDKYRQPKGETSQGADDGDQFVITGISLPSSYIDEAEERLDDAAKEYMLENNVYYFEYPLKFDEYFLTKNQGILSQMRNNTIVRFLYAGVENVLYIKQITVKYGNTPLPQYDITLTDDVEIVLNQIGQTVDEVSKLRVQLNELQKYYSEDIFEEIRTKLSKTIDDVCQGRITFQQGLDSIGDVFFHNKIGSPNFESGLYTGRGWRVDELGNAEFESVRARSFLEVVELLINRQQAMEGDTVFTDNDQIDKVDKMVDSTDQSISYVLSLKEKYDGYITSQMYGNILKGVINTLAAKQAGVSNYNDSDAVEHVGDNTYYTSWMRVIATHNTDKSLGVNQIRVVLYGDDYTPAGKNFEPCELMTIARHGCINYDVQDASKYASEGLSTQAQITESIRQRQQVFYISTKEGRIAKLTGVDKPILENYNYGTTLGTLPEFVKNIGNVREKYIEGRDYLYAQGVVVGDFIKVDISGAPVPELTFCGDWIDGKAEHDPITIAVWDEANQRWVQQVLTYPIPVSEYSNPNSHYIGYGIYLYNEYNPNSKRYETHQVRHNAGLWQCLQHQPVISGGVANTYPPKWNSSYWALVDGNDNLSIEFVSSRGYSFRRGHVDTIITPYLYYGNIDISKDVDAEFWNWTRELENPTEESIRRDSGWNSQHQQQRQLHLTNADMDILWSSSNKQIFTITVTLNDGKTTRIVDNQIIS